MMAVIQITNVCLIVEQFVNPVASEQQTIFLPKKPLSLNNSFLHLNLNIWKAARYLWSKSQTFYADLLCILV